MLSRLFGRKDPICGMKEEKGKGIEKYEKWFCNKHCLEEYERNMKKQNKKGPCC